MIDLRGYQLKAVDGTQPAGLAPAISALLELEGPDRLIVFEAPTGAGKTVMLAAALDRAGHDAATLWLTPGKGQLEEQSAAALTRFLDTSTLSVERLDEAWLSSHAALEPGTVLVANWEALTKVDSTTSKRMNLITRDGEARNLFDALASTADAGTPVIVVIDESHWGADATGTSSLLDDIDAITPTLRIEASATPTRVTDKRARAQGRHYDVTVDLDDVIAAGMLVSRIRVNAGLRQYLDGLSPSDRAGAVGETCVLDAAWKRHGTLTAAYQAKGSPIRPLLLVQLPNSTAGEAKLAAVEAFFAQPGRDITRANGHLAVYLSDDKTDNLDDIATTASSVDVMVFKTGVATGWDCPRAQVLVAFREMHSEIFAIQTVGRILRTPERRHYGTAGPDPLLDAAYVYANIDAPTGPTSRDPKRPQGDDVTLDRTVGPLALPGSYASRAGGYSDIKPGIFPGCFASAATTLNFAATVGNTPPAANESLASDRTVLVGDVLDADHTLAPGGDGTVAVALSDHDLQDSFDRLLGAHLGPYRGRARSLPVMRTAIYDWFRQHKPGWWAADDDSLVLDVQRAAIAHAGALGAVLDAAVAAHQAADTTTARATATFTWELPATLPVSSETHSTPPSPAGYAYTDTAGFAWRRNPSKPESLVETALAAEVAAGRILWWWKNGVGDRRSYSVAYTNAAGDPDTAYPDYVAELPPTTRRRIALLEAKDVADRDPDTPLKAAALAAQLPALQTAGLDAVVGIVAPLAGGIGLNNGTSYRNPTPAALSDPASGWVLLADALR